MNSSDRPRAVDLRGWEEYALRDLLTQRTVEAGKITLLPRTSLILTIGEPHRGA
ncbi:MAG TPA: hypothetical protein EYP85_04580 [Armatimonadetes bacterium]|nr:hypothetical protein [Armatimonadota bacterium]